jgi:hypothetical protein
VSGTRGLVRSYIIRLIIKVVCTRKRDEVWYPIPLFFYQSRSHPGNMPVEMAMRFQLLMVLITMMSVTNCVSS